jgi:hypothetical protein
VSAKRVRRGVATAVAAVALTVPALASAGIAIIPGSNQLGSSHGINYRSSTSANVGVVQQAIAVAYCPDGRQLTGGGATWDLNPYDAYLDDDGPFAFDTHTRLEQWRASGTNFQGANKNLTAFAICKSASGLRIKHEHRAIPSLASRSVRVDCPDGRHVTGGGLVDEPTELARLLGSVPFDDGDRRRKPDDGWRVRLFNFAKPDAEVDAYAICARGLSLAYRRATQELTPPGLGVPVAACRRTEAVVGGGGAISGGGAAAFLNEVAPLDRGDADAVPDDGFITYGVATGGPSHTVGSYAICKR